MRQTPQQDVLLKNKHWSLQRYYITTPQKSHIFASVLETTDTPKEVIFYVEDDYYSASELRAKMRGDTVRPAMLAPQPLLIAQEDQQRPPLIEREPLPEATPPQAERIPTPPPAHAPQTATPPIAPVSEVQPPTPERKAEAPPAPQPAPKAEAVMQKTMCDALVQTETDVQENPETYDQQTQTPRPQLRNASTQTGEGAGPEPEGFFEQFNPKYYAWPPSQWNLPDDKYWFPAVVSIALLQGDIIDMDWFYNLLRKIKLPELRDAIKKHIPQSLVKTPSKAKLSTAAFAFITAALAYYATQKCAGKRLPFFDWNVEKARYFPNFNRMIVWLCVLYGTTEIGKQLFIEAENNDEEF